MNKFSGPGLWNEDNSTPESNDSDGDFVPPNDGNDSDGADEKAGNPNED